MNKKGTIKINLKKSLFIVIFFTIFCFSFLLSVLSNFSYRAALVSLLVLPLLLLYGLRFDRVSFAYGILAVLVFLSGMLNRSSVINIFLFLRILVFSYLIYYLVKIALTPELTKKIIKISVWIAMIQLPIILLQWQLFDILPLRLRGPAALEDFASGTFNYKTDYAMAFFITSVIIFLLFEKRRNYFIKNKFYKALWLSVTVLIANSQIMKIAVLLIWLVFILVNFNFKNILIIGVCVILGGIALLLLSNSGLITEDITTFIDRLTSTGDVDTYLSGGYSRTAALKYLVTDGFTWLGLGPTALSDPITRTLYRGNTGHFFTFFSEIGSLGWLASLLILILIAFPISNGKLKVNWSRILFFAAIFILSFTAQVMNDIAVFLMYCIMCNVNLVPQRASS